MRTGIIVAAAIAVVAIGVGFYMIDVDQTEEAALPDVDISVEGGNLPEYDATVGDVDVGTREVTITVPDVDVQSPEEVANENN